MAADNELERLKTRRVTALYRLDLIGKGAQLTYDDGTPVDMKSEQARLEEMVADLDRRIARAEARGRLNIRFNPTHTGEALMAWLNAEAGRAQAESGLRIELEHLHSGDAFLTLPGPFVTGVQDAVEAAVGRRPEASTTGGTSDARFIRAMCPVLELGLVGQTMHQIDERAPVAEIEALAEVYRAVIGTYFERA